MASLLAEPLICGSLLATKVTLRFPLTVFSQPESRTGKDFVKTEAPESDLAPSAEGQSQRSLSSSPRASNSDDANRQSSEDSTGDDSSAEASSEQFAEVHVLVNCGWSLDFDQESIALLKLHAKDVDVIAITDGDFQHVGALPVIYSWLHGIRGDSGMPPVLCTEGSYKFARACLVDVLENATFSYKFEDYGMSDLDFLYSGCCKLRYHESYHLTKSTDDWTVHTAFLPLNNGVSIGGSVWKLSVGPRSIVCCPTYRVQSSWYLNGCDIGSLDSADIFVTHEQPKLADSSQSPQPSECKNMQAILSVVAGTLRSNGSVLIPMDVDTHIIDLLLHLNAVWENSDLQQFPIVLVSPIAGKMVLLFATCLEYMRAGICHNFLRTMWNPIFNMKYIHPVSTLEELRRFSSMPCVFISTCSSLSFGVTSYLFAALCCYERNTVIFTSESPEVSALMMQYRDRGTIDPLAGLQHDFTLRLNLEPPEETDAADMGKLNSGSRNNSICVDSVDEAHSPVGPSAVGSGDVVMDAFGDELATEFLFKNSRNFSVHNGYVSYMPPTVMRDDIENSNQHVDENLDYGIPYTSVAAAELDQNIAPSSAAVYAEEQEESAHEPDAFSGIEQNPFNAYYMQHVENSAVGGIIFDGKGENDAASEVQSNAAVSKLVVKRLPLVIKSGLYITRHFSHFHPRCELVSLLRKIRPRNIALLPRTSDVGGLAHAERTVREAVPSCGAVHSFDSALPCNHETYVKGKGSLDRRLRIPLDVRQEYVNRSGTLLAAGQLIRDFHGARVTPADKRAEGNSRIERLMSVLSSIDAWKRHNNPRQVYQAIVRFDCYAGETSSRGESVLRCSSFWSKRPSQIPRLSMCLPGDSASATSGPSTDDSERVGGAAGDPDSMGVDSSLTISSTQTASDASDAVLSHSLRHSVYTGNVGMPTLVQYFEECLPECCNLGGGVLTVNGSVQLSRSDVRYGVQRWNVRGTLDPAFYFSRKMLRKLHNRIEPLY
ncbi:probable cleavage and polyadenylation specificity factor subunit 2-like protein [Babesia ovata]|uniref:Cleavage and polyadenylation specificity factor subunit 2 n=1 Tax=Babesia ovata TaxID=189622 RepID=A0A2H6KD43_9APIC|nr:probable cleavage and polyadenylation specificity factor subunit 2-like protein [Babesia ovata]GBE60907.1 probable cleavage and polyadenylation specificity factor subunit 2-like protein [Babesia ovata]